MTYFKRLKNALTIQLSLVVTLLTLSPHDWLRTDIFSCRAGRFPILRRLLILKRSISAQFFFANTMQSKVIIFAQRTTRKLGPAETEHTAVVLTRSAAVRVTKALSS